MIPQTQVAKSLHDEHVAVIALMERLGNTVSTALENSDPQALTRLLTDVLAAIEGEIIPHFDFEEQHLFPILDDEGAGDLSELLSDENVVIRALSDQVKLSAKLLLDNDFSAEAWNRFKQPAFEFSDRLSAHASMEEAGLIPLLDDLIDEDQDSGIMEHRWNQGG